LKNLPLKFLKEDWNKDRTLQPLTPLTKPLEGQEYFLKLVKEKEHIFERTNAKVCA